MSGRKNLDISALMVANLAFLGLAIAGCDGDDGNDGSDAAVDSQPISDGSSTDDSGGADGSMVDDADQDIEPAQLCSSSRGLCVDLVNGCADCAAEDMPVPWTNDCIGGQWCCEPREARDSACEEAGGVCKPVVPQALCPEGWEDTDTDCGMGGSCCEPAASCS